MASASKPTFPPTMSVTDDRWNKKVILHMYPSPQHDQLTPPQKLPSAVDHYKDVNFNIWITLEGGDKPDRHKSYTSTVLSKQAAVIMQKRGVRIDWSGTEPPQGTEAEAEEAGIDATSGSLPFASTSSRGPSTAARAASLTDEVPTWLADLAFDLLDRFWAANPDRRDVHMKELDALPGLAGQGITIKTQNHTEQFFNTILQSRHIALSNAILALLHEAAAWDYQQTSDEEKGSKYWPVPVDAPLEIVSQRPKAAPPLLDLPEDMEPGPTLASRRTNSSRLVANPDFYLVYGRTAVVPQANDPANKALLESDLPAVQIMGTLESKPHLTSAAAHDWVEPRAAPLARERSRRAAPVLSTVHEDIETQMHEGAAKSTTASASGARTPLPETYDFAGYNIETWAQKLTLQMTSHAYLNGTTCCAAFIDWGQGLVLCELHALQGASQYHQAVSQNECEDSRCEAQIPSPELAAPTPSPHAFVFASEAIYSFLPAPNARLGTADDPAEVAKNLSENSTSTSSARLKFSALPSIPWATVHWCMYACYVELKKVPAEEPDVALYLTQHLEARLSLGGESGSRRDREDGGPAQNRELPDDSHSGQTDRGSETRRCVDSPGDGAACDQSSTCDRVNSALSIREMAVFPAPFAYGAYANIYLCLLDIPVHPSTENRRMYEEGQNTFCASTLFLPAAKVDRTKTIVKAHRLPLTDSEANPSVGDYAPALLERPTCLGVSEWQEEVAAVNLRTQREIETYRRLEPLQGTFVPTLRAVAPAHYEPVSLSSKLVLEAVGASLASIANHAPRFFLAWTKEIRALTTAALSACHDQGVLHGDIHEGNIVASWTAAAHPPSAEEGAPEQQDELRLRVSLVDWSSACIFPRGTRPPAGWVREEMARISEILDFLESRARERLRVHLCLSQRVY